MYKMPYFASKASSRKVCTVKPMLISPKIEIAVYSMFWNSTQS
jgi:hypothetical protein